MLTQIMAGFSERRPVSVRTAKLISTRKNAAGVAALKERCRGSSEAAGF
jgi:hypothetical protein